MDETYDLERAPIILRQNSDRTIGIILGSLAFAGLSAWMMSSRPYLGAGGIALCLTFALLGGAQLIWPSSLTICAEGLTYRYLTTTDLRWRWCEIGTFSVGAYGSVVFTGGRRNPILGKIYSRVFDMKGDESLPDIWPLKPADLAELLNAARDRWA